MADVRSLLRQQRAARRIVHPHAAYSDAGKLLCTLCHEQVKAESLWDGHIRSLAHLSRVEKLQQSRSSPERTDTSNKRKHGSDEDMDDVVPAGQERDGLGRKRSRLGTQESGLELDVQPSGKDKADDGATDTEKTTPTRIKPPTPPFPRRSSGTPSQGVEIRIPSRPATPVAMRTDHSAANGALNRSPLRQHKEPASVAGFAPTSAGTAPAPTAAGQADPPPPLPPQDNAPPSSGTQGHRPTQEVDENEWAAFEADLLQEKTNGTSARPNMEAPADAVISAPAMTADEIAAKSAEEERDRRRATADVELSNEKEDATRALEEEFEDMEELEARVRRLKERREALRRLHRDSPPAALPAASSSAEQGKSGGVGTSDGKGNAADAAESDGEEDDDEDDEDEDDWAGFRFKG